jgi:hypothetical protein
LYDGALRYRRGAIHIGTLILQTTSRREEVPAMAWKTCEVTWAGPTEQGSIYIALKATDGSFERWFQAFPGMQKEMLATALCALSCGLRVDAALPDNLQEYSVCERLYVHH